jgi:DNA ligase (NAD+)
MLTPTQQTLLQQSSVSFNDSDVAALCQIAQSLTAAETLNDASLLDLLALCNALYRGGEALISNDAYDRYCAELQRRHPQHPWLTQIEPEPAFAGKTVALPATMLSTDKAYTFAEVERWAGRIEKAAGERDADFSQLLFKVTPKLDGYAAYDDGTGLYTRGDGRKGTDISRVFQRGLQVAQQGARGLGAGEIVVSRDYFAAHLADYFDNSRNFQASVIKEKQLEAHAEQAIADGAAVFYPFALLPAWTGSWQQLQADFDAIVQSIWHCLDYDVDGVIIEIVDEPLKQALGATRHHHRWQLAYKENLNRATVTVRSVTPQTSRAGRITPVAELAPVRLSGALLSRATAHHYRMVIDKGIGAGAVIELARSGEVIPKIERVITPATPDVPEHCPSCQHALIWDNDYLLCPNNLDCPAQISHSLAHFFKVLKNNDGFGDATIQKLYQHGIRQLDAIYALTAEQLQAMGFGPKQSHNLIEQLVRSRTEPVEDWRFLAAFGVFRMGLGNCERLLQHHPLEAIFDLNEADIIAIEGFAEKTARVIVEGFAAIKPLFQQLQTLGFSLQASQRHDDSTSHPLAGKTLVFTGSLQAGSRDELAKRAKACGAKVGSAVSAKTDYLVMGDGVGAAKRTAAAAKGVALLSEAEFLQLLEPT